MRTKPYLNKYGMELPHLKFNDLNSALCAYFHKKDGFEKVFDNPKIHYVVGQFCRYIELQSEEVRDELIEALILRDRHEKYQKFLKSADEEYVIEHREKIFKSFNDVANYSKASERVIGDVYSLWDSLAHLIRSSCQLDIPLNRQMNIKTLLKYVYQKPELKELIEHTEFVSNEGRDYFRNGSVIQASRNYRDFSTHICGIQIHSLYPDRLLKGENVDSALLLYDHKDGKDLAIAIPKPSKIINLAEKSYRHFIKGAYIGEKTILNNLGLSKKNLPIGVYDRIGNCNVSIVCETEEGREEAKEMLNELHQKMIF